VARPIREEIGRVALGDSERHVEGPALRVRTLTHPVEEGQQQLMKSAEGQPCLGLSARRRHHRRAALARSLPGRLQQRRLADTRLAPDDEGTPTRRNLIDHSEDAVQFLIAPYEQPPGGFPGVRTSIGNIHAHPPGSRR
jgi:hypothetical protein